MQEYRKAVQEMESQIISHRRTLHRHPEVGAHLPRTAEYVTKQLTALGYTPTTICDSGIVATITGKDTGRCILLRADMDAVNIREETGLPFASENGAMHACGHDMHTAMLLGAASLLQTFRSRLEGTVKLVFQPDEEGFSGAKTMLSSGVLENPAPQAGFALHIHSGTPSGMLLCGRDTFMAGCTVFRITVNGTGCHGAMPETGVDPIPIAAQIHTALQGIVSREISPKTPISLTVGKFSAGNGANIIPPTAVMEGTLRTFDQKLTGWVLTRMEYIASQIAQAFRGSAKVEVLADAPPLANNSQLVTQMAGYCEALLGKERVVYLPEGGMGSEDFASFTHQLPCAYLLLGAGTKEENPLFGKPMHNERVIFNEEILPIGAAIETCCAIQWLKNR